MMGIRNVYHMVMGWMVIPLVVCGQEVAEPLPVDRLKVMSYNIRIASPPSKGWGYTDLRAVADVINREQPDLVALQEVDAFTDRSGKAVHQARMLGELTGMYWYFAKAIDRSNGDYGVAVLSRYPLISAETHRLPVAKDSEGEIRGCALVILNVGDRELAFLSAHLDHQRDEDRKVQVKVMNRILRANRNRVVVFGADLNMEQHHPVARRLKRYLSFVCDTCAPTFPSEMPQVTLDYILLNRKARQVFSVDRYMVIPETYASDHRPVVALLRFKTQTKK